MTIVRSCRSRFSQLIVLLLLALVPTDGKNILSRVGDLMTAPASSAEYDAATGTVSDQSAKQANSCDGQLAAALVQANDLKEDALKGKEEALAKHENALATIASLEKNLSDTKTGLQKEIDDLLQVKETLHKVISEEKEKASLELEAVSTQARKDYEALEKEKDARFTEFQIEASEKLKALYHEASNDYKSLKTEKDAAIEDLRTKLKMSNEELEATMRSELEKAKQEKDAKVAELTASRDESVARLTQAMEKAATDALELLQTTKEEYEAAISTLEMEKEESILLLKEEMEIAAADAAHLLETTKAEAKAFLKDQLTAVMNESDQAQMENDERLAGKEEEIKTMHKTINQIMEEKAVMEQALEEANAEIAHWRNLHAGRSYCNMTHITSDFLEASANYGRQASDVALALYAESKKQAEAASEVALAHVTDGLTQSKQFVHEQVDEAWPVIQPYYEEHIAANYQTHLEPHLKEHVFPKVQQARGWFQTTVVPFASDILADIRHAYNTQVIPIVQREYRAVVAIYGYYCNQYLSEFHKASKTSEILRDHPPPAYFVNSWESACANPQESMTALIHGTMGFLALIFHRRILALIWWIVTSSLSLVVRLTPLRWILPIKSSARKSVDTSVPLELEENGKSGLPPALSKSSLDSPDAAAKEMAAQSNDDEDLTTDPDPVDAKLY